MLIIHSMGTYKETIDGSQISINSSSASHLPLFTDAAIHFVLFSGTRFS